MSGICDEFQEVTSIITIDRERICRWIKTRRNPDRFRIYRLAGSFKSAKSADCIIATNAGPHSAAMWLFQSIADFFYLSWHLLRSLFMSQEALEKENAEMRRQIAELKAEAAQPTNEDDSAAARAGPE